MRGFTLSSEGGFATIPFEELSGLVSVVAVAVVAVAGVAVAACDIFRVFCAEPRIPSRVKLGVRAADFKDEVGDFKDVAPLAAAAAIPGAGISTVKSRFGI